MSAFFTVKCITFWTNVNIIPRATPIFSGTIAKAAQAVTFDVANVESFEEFAAVAFRTSETFGRVTQLQFVVRWRDMLKFLPCLFQYNQVCNMFKIIQS